MSTEEWLTLTLLAVLTIAVAGAAALAAAEVAILRLRRSRIRVAGDSGDATAVGLLKLLEDLPLVLNTVLLSVLFLQVGAATVAGFLAARFFGGPGATAASVLLTGVLFLYGEAIPKTIAVRHPEAVARRAARPLRILVIVLRPVVKVLTTLANWQIPGSLSQPTDDSMSEAELRAVLRESAPSEPLKTMTPRWSTDRSNSVIARSVTSWSREIMSPRSAPISRWPMRSPERLPWAIVGYRSTARISTR